MLTEGAHALLLEEHACAESSIKFLDEYINRTGNKISSGACYLAIKNFVIPALEKQADLGNTGENVDLSQLEETLDFLYGKDKTHEQ